MQRTHDPTKPKNKFFQDDGDDDHGDDDDDVVEVTQRVSFSRSYGVSERLRQHTHDPTKPRNKFFQEDDDDDHGDDDDDVVDGIQRLSFSRSYGVSERLMQLIHDPNQKSVFSKMTMMLMMATLRWQIAGGLSGPGPGESLGEMRTKILQLSVAGRSSAPRDFLTVCDCDRV